MRKIEVMGSGYARPQHRIDNQDLETILDTSDEWIVQRTGIHSRYVSTEETTSMLAARAAQAALDNAGVDKEAIALLIVATLSGDQPMPSTACLVQEQLGMMDQDLMPLISTRHAAASSLRCSVPAPCWRMDSAR